MALWVAERRAEAHAHGIREVRAVCGGLRVCGLSSLKNVRGGVTDSSSTAAAAQLRGGSCTRVTRQHLGTPGLVPALQYSCTDPRSHCYHGASGEAAACGRAACRWRCCVAAPQQLLLRALGAAGGHGAFNTPRCTVSLHSVDRCRTPGDTSRHGWCLIASCLL